MISFFGGVVLDLPSGLSVGSIIASTFEINIEIPRRCQYDTDVLLRSSEVDLAASMMCGLRFERR